MTTPSNALNVTAAGLVKFDGTSAFTGQTVTQYNALVGGASNAISSIAPSATAGVPLISAGSSSNPAFGTAVVAGGGTGAVTLTGVLTGNGTSAVTANAVTQNGVLLGGATNAVASLGVATNGQLVIGSTATTPVLAALTEGTGVTITNGAGSITISASGAGFDWTDVTGSTQALAVSNGYITDNAGGVAYTLPATAALGDALKIVGKSGLATITPNANQQILIGSGSGAVGATGTAVSTNAGDCIQLICITAGASTVWRADSVIGTWTLTT